MTFHLTSACGNVFVLIDSALAAGSDKGLMARQLCRAGPAAPADGVVYYRRNAKGADFSIFNRNGSEAEISGNGMAGLAAMLFETGFPGPEVRLAATGGVRRVLRRGRSGSAWELQVEIGVPDFACRRFFPFLQEGRPDYEIGGVRFCPVSVGNPHAVVLLSAWPDGAGLLEKGKTLAGAAQFPMRTNVEFALPKDRGACRVFFYERGVGPTAASGTGSAAVFAVLRRLGKAHDLLDLDAPGGRIRTLAQGDAIFVETAAILVREGELASENLTD